MSAFVDSNQRSAHGQLAPDTGAVVGRSAGKETRVGDGGSSSPVQARAATRGGGAGAHVADWAMTDGLSAALGLADAPAAHASAVQRKDAAAAEASGAAPTAGSEVENDAVYGGVVKSVVVDNTPLVSDASKPASTEVVKLSKANQVTPTDLGVGSAFNKGAEGTGKAWWKVKIVKGTNTGKEGWVQVDKLGSILNVKKAGTSEYSGKVGAGQVEIHTGQELERDGSPDGDNNFALTYTGKDAADSRWLQFIWREVIGVDDKGASTPMKGSITTTGGTYDLTDDGTAAKAGTPAKNNYNTDCPNPSDPFYEAFGEGERTADSAKMIDLPGPMTPKVEAAFKGGAKKVVSRAHFTTFLVQARKVTFKTKIDVLWDFKSKADAALPPAGSHTVSESGAATELPKTIAERFHEQYPAFKDIK